MQFFLLALAILPILVIGIYVNRKDKNQEPTKLLVKLFLAGIASCFLTVFISEIFSAIHPVLSAETKKTSLLEILIYAFIGVALVEEGSKLLMTYVVGYKHKQFDELYDIIVYAVFVALGFAAFENVLYVFINGSQNINRGIFAGVFRALLAVPGHACDGLFMGYYLCFAKISELQNQKKLSKKYLLMSLIVPTILHGTYDFCLFTEKLGFLIVFFVFVIFMYISSIKKLKYIATNNRSLYNEDKYCTNCGTKATGIFCANCGHRIQ